MTLLITALAAVISTIAWYNVKAERKLGTLALMYWGASLMWLVDAIVEYAGKGADYFKPGLDGLINDSFLGMSVVVLGLIIWTVVLLVKDPDGKVRSLFSRK